MTEPTPGHDARRADDEAVAWVIRLREEAGEPDVRARFDAWLAESPLNARAWADTAYAYERAGHTRPAFSPDGTPEDRSVLPPGPVPLIPHAGRSRTSIGRWPRHVRRRTALAVAAAACLALVAAPALMLRLRADHVTGTAELREVQLADGSTAHLAPGSAVAIAYAADRRRVQLLKGEAWFDVRHDPARPFQVDAGGITTTVVGTAFDVKLDSGGAATEVARGRVRVDYASGAVSEQLAAGDRLHVAFDGTRDRTSRPIEQVAAWRDRRIIVHDRPIGEVIDALRPWFNGTIIVRDGRLARQRVTGVYNTTDPVEALHGLTRVHGGRVTAVTPWVILLTER